MERLADCLRPLAPAHREALMWFQTHQGTDIAWAEVVAVGEETGRRLVTAAKGIYKPEGWPYALSVRQTLGGPYPDREPVVRADGTWLYRYFQENPDPALRDEQYTNRGLVACLHDRVPVGVLLQVTPKPGVRYRVLGVALVAGWDSGYFFLEGFTSDGVAHSPGLATEREELLGEAALAVAAEDATFAAELSIPETDAGDIPDVPAVGDIDARRRVLTAIVRRQGQGMFRDALLNAYERRCAVTGCDVEAALEAAHIIPYRGPHSNVVTNGLLLRADIHTLFDLGYLAIDITDPAAMTICLAPHLATTVYAELNGAPLRLPTAPEARPSAAALDQHREWTGL